MIGTNIKDSEWIFEGSALNTLNFLRRLINAENSEGIRDFVLKQMLEVEG